MSDKRSKKELMGEVSRLSENVDEIAGEINKAMGELSRTAGTVGRQISRGVEAAESIGQSIRRTLQGVRRLPGVGAKRESLVKVPIDQADLDWLDVVVEAGMMDSRSDAAAFFIGEGVKARHRQLELISEKMSKMRREKEMT